MKITKASNNAAISHSRDRYFKSFSEGYHLKNKSSSRLSGKEINSQSFFTGYKNITLSNHFSMGPSFSTLKFNNCNVHIIGNSNEQIILEDRIIRNSYENSNQHETETEEEYRHDLTMKRVKVDSFGLVLLRFIYVFVAMLLYGFLFVFTCQSMLFVFFNLFHCLEQRIVRYESPSLDVVIRFIGALFSIPIFVFGLATLMSLGWTFVTESWNGHVFMRSVLNVSIVTTEWINFTVFLLIPALAMITSLFSMRDDWWEITATAWVISVGLYMLFFCIAVTVCETIAYYRLIIYKLSSDKVKNNFVNIKHATAKNWRRLILYSIYLRERNLYSGVKKERYILEGSDRIPTSFSSANYNDDTLFDEDHVKPYKVNISLYSRLTRLPFLRCIFDTLEETVKIYSFDEINDVAPFITNNTWSLETMFCINKKTHGILLERGNGALKDAQLRSNVACLIIGSIIILLIFVAFINFAQLGRGILFLILILFVLCAICIWVPVIPFYRNFIQGRKEWARKKNVTTQHTKDYSSSVHEEATNSSSPSSIDNLEEAYHEKNLIDDNNESMVTFQMTKEIRITEPRVSFCIFVFVLQFIFFFAWPLFSFFIAGNLPIGVVFMKLGTLSFVQINCSVAALLPDIGSINTISLDSFTTSDEILGFRFLLAEILLKARGPVKRRWVLGYSVLFVFIAFLFSVAHPPADVSSQDDYNGITLSTLAPGFEYPPRNITNSVGNLLYQSCTMTKGFEYPDGTSAKIIDMAFLATVAYAGPDYAQTYLDEWFGENQAQDEYLFVRDYMTETNTLQAQSYKLISFNDFPGFAIMSIRGTTGLYDWLVDTQLWSAACLSQVVRFVMPMGYIWDPIYHKLVRVINLLQTTHLRDESNYVFTTNFVKALLNGYGKNKFRELRITGHSLGGGIGIITGAQTGVSTMALSGVNSMLSRETFTPPLTVEQLNTRVMNVIPKRDPVPRIDDPGDVVLRINCTGASYDPITCHYAWRSICELLYQCGSDGRPIPCVCVSTYEYPMPNQIGDKSWQDACIFDTFVQ